MESVNPILPGFNPDPSILRVGGDYYIATSTFEWFPGVQIHHSRDLANWRLRCRPLDRLSQLNMMGNPDSGGIWAPCLSFHEGTYYLIYTDVKRWKEDPYKIISNYLVTAPAIEGPWSDPVFLNSSGFDPSLYHAEDGRKWLLNVNWDHRKGRNRFGGILLQEFDEEKGELVGESKNIYLGTERGLVEGPHVYCMDGYYYLITAEGGTEYRHAVTVARSRSLDGPYETHPDKHLLSSLPDPRAALQKGGHGSLVETPEGEWYLAHLCGRPLPNRRCILGRETALQNVIWREGWPYLEAGGMVPSPTFRALPGAKQKLEPAAQRHDFDGEELPIDFQSLRRPIEEDWCSLKARRGHLRLYGQEPTTSLFRQSLLARRVQAFRVEATTCLDFRPTKIHHMAGLIAYYDTRLHYYLRMSWDEKLGRNLAIIKSDGHRSEEIEESYVALEGGDPVFLRAAIDHADLRFSFSRDGENWQSVGPILDASILSDECASLGFTGAFLGMCAQDITGHRRPADFDFFEYRELEERSASGVDEDLAQAAGRTG